MSGPRPARRAALLVAALLVAGLALLVAACGTTGPTPTPRPSPSTGAPGSGPPGSGATGSGAPGPLATPWLGNAVLGVEALGVSDGEIRQAINDLTLGIRNEDEALMQRAAEGLAGVDVLIGNAERMEPYPPMAELAAGLEEVFTRIAATASRLRDAIDTDDGPGITSASRELFAALSDYARLQPQLADWVVQVPEQKRILVR